MTAPNPAAAHVDSSASQLAMASQAIADQRAGRVVLAPSADALNRVVTRRDLLALGAYVAEHHPDPAVRAALGEMWEYFTVRWREEGR